MENKSLGIKDIQKVSLEILKFVANICEREGYRYCLIYGTLIGAIRHKGYIPWDDDVDIMMPRPDYEKFLEYANTHKDEMGVYKIFNRRMNTDYIYGITRISDSRYVIIKEDEKNCGMGIFIDIYPYDGLGNDHKKAIELLTVTRHYCDTIADMTRKEWKVPETLNWKGKISYIINMYANKFRGVGYFHSKINSLRKGYQFENSRYVGPLMWYFMKPHTVCYDHSLFDEFIKVPFEDGEFYVPKEYDKLLTQAYGDYMTPPPIEKRIYHHQYKAYKK